MKVLRSLDVDIDLSSEDVERITRFVRSIGGKDFSVEKEAKLRVFLEVETKDAPTKC